MSRPRLELDREVCFGVVMYGGSSLAVYINGVAQELLNLVRSTAPDPRDPNRARLADEELQSIEVVYRRSAALLPANGNSHGVSTWWPTNGDGSPAGEARDEGVIRTRFVVDLLSGSSAGGINAVLLAKALANDPAARPAEAALGRAGGLRGPNERRSFAALLAGTQAPGGLNLGRPTARHSQRLRHRPTSRFWRLFVSGFHDASTLIELSAGESGATTGNSCWQGSRIF